MIRDACLHQPARAQCHYLSHSRFLFGIVLPICPVEATCHNRLANSEGVACLQKIMQSCFPTPVVACVALPHTTIGVGISSLTWFYKHVTHSGSSINMRPSSGSTEKISTSKEQSAGLNSTLNLMTLAACVARSPEIIPEICFYCSLIYLAT